MYPLISQNCDLSNCIQSTFEWEDASSGGSNWERNDVFNSYTINYPGGSIGVELTLIDPDNRNGDDDLNAPGLHPFDPLGGCDAAAGTCDAGEDDIPGNGSINDPWDADCGLFYTETDGLFGPEYLSFAIKTATSDEVVTMQISFDTPVLICDFKISDIDYVGLQWTFDNLCDEEAPAHSFQDEIRFVATGPTGSVPLGFTTNNSGALIVDNAAQTVRANYISSNNGGMLPTNPDGEITIFSTNAITELLVQYSNGPQDQIDEQANPNLYSWWSDANGATNGVSDDQAIRVDQAVFCVFPVMIANATGNQICIGETANVNLTFSEGVAPYTFSLNGVPQAGFVVLSITFCNDNL